MNELATYYQGQPVLFLEHDYATVAGNRDSVWWAAFDGIQARYPMAMASSGHQVADGSASTLSFYERYQGMVEAELARPPGAVVEAYEQRVGDSVVVNLWITNQSEVTLGPATGATVTALVYEATRVQLTDRFVRAAPYAWIALELLPGQTGAFRLETEPLSGVAWERLQTVALVDYRPPGSDAHDMLQAAYAQPGSLTVAPERLTFFVDETARDDAGRRRAAAARRIR